MKPFPIILISGPSCTGKTTLAKKIAKIFDLPIVSKDGVKELLFDGLGWKDREWSKKLGTVSFDIFFYFIGILLAVRKPFIIESPFKSDFHTAKFLELKQKYSFSSIQIMCRCDGKQLLERFKKRSESGERHPGHVDHLNYKEFEPALLKGYHEPLGIGGKIIEIDTTDFDKVDEKALFKTISSALS